MKIYLPTGDTTKLDNSLSIEEKIIVVNNFISEYEDYCIENQGNKYVKYFLENLANYLVWHKYESQNKEDKEILSRGKIQKMNIGGGMINFSQLDYSDSEKLGIYSKNEDYDN